MADQDKIPECCSRKLIHLIFGQTTDNVVQLIFAKNLP